MNSFLAMSPDAPEMTDRDVIAGVLAGDRAQFATLVRRHNQVLFRACRAVLRDDAEAEDAVQVAWINAYRALANFRSDASFRTWVTRIAVNEAASRLRHRKKLVAITMEEEASMDQSPEHEVLTKELARMLEREISSLPEGLRSVLVLRDVIEMDTAETAESLGIAEENVRVRLHRARQTLAQRLQDSTAELLHAAMPDVWRFDGERCARMLANVMAAL